MAPVMDGYIRVSRRGGREGDSYHSPEIQREEIERWARTNDVTIGKIEVEKKDTSGAVAIEDRKLGRLIDRVEAGVSDGVIVYNTSRFARDVIETLVAVKRLKDADGRLVGVSDGVDSEQTNGKLVVSIMATMAEVYLDGIKAGWSAATDRAVADGKHIAARAPTGYLRADHVDPQYNPKGELIKDARLIEDPKAAPVVRRAFEMKGEGASLAEIRDYMAEALGRGSSKTTVADILKNRVYLGEARGPGGAVNRTTAHDAIVDEATFSRAQIRGKSAPRNGSLARKTLLGGLVTCASCGHLMRVLGATRKSTGGRIPTYACAKHFAGGDCEAPTTIQAAKLDEYIAQLLRAGEADIGASVESAEVRFIEQREKVKEAEAALDDWVDDPAIATSIGPERFKRGLIARQDAFDDAQRDLWNMDDPGLPEDALIVRIGDMSAVYAPWGDDLDADRKHIRRCVNSVTVAKADPKRRTTQPISERVKVAWVGAENG